MKRNEWLCNKCDIELNELILRYFNVPDVEETMAAYRETMG